LKYTDL